MVVKRKHLQGQRSQTEGSPGIPLNLWEEFQEVKSSQ